MIKTESDHIQDMFQEGEVEVSAERREQLARKGQTLYGKFCGTNGHGICAESFAEYHAWRGEWAIVRDLLAYLYKQVETLRQTQADGERLSMTELLINRIEAIIGEKV
jgi:hypothetical protein